MLNSLVRVTRRVRWTAYKTPQIIETVHRKASTIDTIQQDTPKEYPAKGIKAKTYVRPT